MTETNPPSDDPSLSRVLDLLAGIRNEIAAIKAEQEEIPKRLKRLESRLEMWTEVSKILSESIQDDPDDESVSEAR